MHKAATIIVGILSAAATQEHARAQVQPVEEAAIATSTVTGVATKPLTVEDTVGDILDHPALNGFAPLILPWDGRRYDTSMPLQNMESLMPYHSEVRPDVALAALNGLLEQAAVGRRVFYPLYADRPPVSGSSPETAGLFFYRGEPDAPFAIVSPGGGFAYVGSLHEGFPYAQAISARGLNAFVLRYRPGQGGLVATQDLAAAVTWIFEHADELAVSTEGFSLWGSSAGARMAASIGSQGVAAYGGDELPQPSAVIMAYTGHSDLGEDEPATFAVVGARDRIASPSTMQRRVEALRQQGTRVEYQEYSGLGHGFGLGVGTVAEGWADDAVAFWRSAVD